MGDAEVPSAAAASPSFSFDSIDESLSTPNCERCLSRMEPAVTLGGGAHWSCPECGQTRLA